MTQGKKQCKKEEKEVGKAKPKKAAMSVYVHYACSMHACVHTTVHTTFMHVFMHMCKNAATYVCIIQKEDISYQKKAH